MRQTLGVLAVMVTLVLAPATASAEPSYSWGYDYGGDGSPDVHSVTTVWDDNGWLIFGINLHRGYLFTGEEVGVFLDVNGHGSDYKLRMHQYGDGTVGVSLLGAYNGNWSYLSSQYAGGWLDGAKRQVVVYVHRSQIGWPGTGAYYAGFSWDGNTYFPITDFAPNGGYWYLGAATQVGGARGPGVPPTQAPLEPETPSEDPTPPVEEQNPATEAPAGSAPRVNAAKAKRAMRKYMLGKLPVRSKLKLTRCGKRSGGTVYRCKVRATQNARVWKGWATTSKTAAGRYKTVFKGTRYSGGCRCTRPQNWDW
jgi:hypothetical protein